MGTPALETRLLSSLSIQDEASFKHVALYQDLKDVLLRANYPVRVLPKTHEGRWDRALILNLTFWGVDGGAGGDVLVDDLLEADVVGHAAWHHLAAGVLAGAPGKPPSVDALFLGEAIASAFDLYLVGRLLGHAPRSSFLASQVPAMAEAAEAAGLPEEDFETLLEGVAKDPDRAFEDLRSLLVDACRALFGCRNAQEGFAALAALDGHRFGPLLHRYELSNWVLYARAFGDAAPDQNARDVDQALRTARASMDWLEANWVRPALK